MTRREVLDRAREIYATGDHYGAVEIIMQWIDLFPGAGVSAKELYHMPATLAADAGMRALAELEREAVAMNSAPGIGQRFRLSAGKVLTYVGIASGGSWRGLLKFSDTAAPDGEGIPMYIDAPVFVEAIRCGRMVRNA